MKLLAVNFGLLALLASSPALAEDPVDVVNGHRVFWAVPGQHYAVRALCAPNGAYTALEAIASNIGYFFQIPFGTSCVNNHVGLDFTAPASAFNPAARVAIVLRTTTQATAYDPKIIIQRDCAEGMDTVCRTSVNGLPTTIYGKIAWAGDHDWIEVLHGGLELNLVTATIGNCFVAASVVHDSPSGRDWVRVAGGPAGCIYQIAVTERR